jgi:hypothetical protein
MISLTVMRRCPLANPNVLAGVFKGDAILAHVAYTSNTVSHSYTVAHRGKTLFPLFLTEDVKQNFFSTLAM